jgi:hypothetical protein
MGFLSALFGTANKPSQEEMELFAQYGELVEELGAEEVTRGQDETLLPADKTKLRQTIAQVSLNPLSGLLLDHDDLTKLYGMLEFFVGSDELELIDEARMVASEIENGADATDEQIRTFEAGMGILQNALEEFQKAAEKLKQHAASLS